ncbi:PepSY domain-containing protein, partial [Dysosmobacter welbionis]
AASLRGQQNLHRLAAANGLRHPGRDLPQQAVGRQHTDGPQQDIRPPGVKRHGVLAGGAVVRPRPQHSGGGQRVGPQRPHMETGPLFLHSLHQAPAHAAAL